MTVPPAPVRAPSQRPLARVSRRSANDKGDNEVKPGAVHRSPGICLTAEENPWKASARRPSDEGCATSHSLKWDTLFPHEVGRIAQNVMEGQRRKEGKDSNVCIDISFFKVHLF